MRSSPRVAGVQLWDSTALEDAVVVLDADVERFGDDAQLREVMAKTQAAADGLPLPAVTGHGFRSQGLPGLSSRVRSAAAGDSAYMEVDRNVAEQKVRAPAIALLVSAAIGALAQLVALVLVLVGADLPWAQYKDAPQEWAEFADWFESFFDASSVGLGLVSLGVAGFMIFGALKMTRLESYGIALATTILALIPCLSPCCCLTLPIGIWALVVMHAPDVRPAFH